MNSTPQTPAPSGPLANLGVYLIERWRLVIGLPLMLAVLAVAASFLLPRSYTASTSFAPESREASLPAAAGLMSIASQFGLTGSSPSRSPQFYGDVTRSRRVLHAVMLSTVTDPRTPDPADSTLFINLLTDSTGAMSSRLDKGVERLRRVTAVNVNPRTGIVELYVVFRYPETAAEVARQFLVALTDFNLTSRQSTARERRRFAQARLAEAEDSLAMADGDIRSFLERNARHDESPRLLFEHGRLERRQVAYQQLATMLRQEYESARVEEVNDTPVMTIVDSAVVPRRASAPSRAAAGVGGLMFGAVMVLIGLLTSRYLSEMQGTDPASYARVRQATSMITRRIPFLRRPS